MKNIARIMAALVVTGALVVASGTAANATVKEQGGVGCGQLKTTIKNIRSAGTQTRSPGGPDWSVSGRGPATLVLSKSLAVSNSFTGTVGISGEVLSGTLGFNVTKGYTTATSYSYKIPAKQTWVVRADAIYSVKKYDWSVKQSCNGGGSKNLAGTGTACKFMRLQYRAYRS